MKYYPIIFALSLSLFSCTQSPDKYPPIDIVKESLYGGWVVESLIQGDQGFKIDTFYFATLQRYNYMTDYRTDHIENNPFKASLWNLVSNANEANTAWIHYLALSDSGTDPAKIEIKYVSAERIEVSSPATPYKAIWKRYSIKPPAPPQVDL